MSRTCRHAAQPVCQVFTPPVKAMYVLEVNAGFIAAHQISLGDKFNFLMFALPMA